MLAQIARVQCGNKVGTAFLVDSDLVLTALHNIADRTTSPLRFLGEPHLMFPVLQSSVVATVVPDAWDVENDWVLLRLPRPPSVPPLPLAAISPGTGAAWETDGFSAGGDVTGLRFRGKIADIEALRPAQDGQALLAYQLFSEEAAAGDGAPVEGLSGAPCIVSDAVVGIIRSALKCDGLAVAGTLFATPIATVLAKAADHLPLPDLVWGLPGIRNAPLPASPVRHLGRFRQEHAGVFFGRNAEIRTLYDWVTKAPENVLLVYGQSGVGKSSLLDAGLCSRLRNSHHPIYHRRIRGTPLATQLTQLLTPTPLPNTSTPGEATPRRPQLLILDQIEEVLVEGSREELDDLASSLALHLQASPHKLILGFRKEWLPEIESALQRHGIENYGRRFIERLNHRALVEALLGFELPALKEKYRLSVTKEDAEYIASKLDADPASAIGPTFQIILDKMWTTASHRDPNAPRLDRKLFDELWGHEGIGPEEFVRTQIDALPSSARDHIASGLVLDLLLFHVTMHNTSWERSEQDCDECYPPSLYKAAELRRHLTDVYLLVEPPSTSASQSYRLAHDTLASAIRKMAHHSQAPGQRRRRILERRIASWRAEATDQASVTTEALLDHHLLNDYELRAVENGSTGTRIATTDEQLIIEASERFQKRQRIAMLLIRAAGVGVLSLLLFVAFRITDVSHWIHFNTIIWAERSALEVRNDVSERLGPQISESYHCAWFQAFHDGKMIHPGAATAFAPASGLSGSYFVLVGGRDTADGEWRHISGVSQPIWDESIFETTLAQSRQSGTDLGLPVRYPPVPAAAVFTGAASERTVAGGFARLYATYGLDRSLGGPRASECSTTVAIVRFEHGVVLAGAPNDYCSETDRVYVLFNDPAMPDRGTWTATAHSLLFGSQFRASCL